MRARYICVSFSPYCPLPQILTVWWGSQIESGPSTGAKLSRSQEFRKTPKIGLCVWPPVTRDHFGQSNVLTFSVPPSRPPSVSKQTSQIFQAYSISEQTSRCLQAYFSVSLLKQTSTHRVMYRHKAGNGGNGAQRNRSAKQQNYNVVMLWQVWEIP